MCRELSAPKEVSPFSPPKQLPEFDEEKYISYIKEHGGPGPTVLRRVKGGQWMTLYRRFCRGSNFREWFNRCCEQILAERHQDWQHALVSVDIRGAIAGFSEAQVLQFLSSLWLSRHCSPCEANRSMCFWLQLIDAFTVIEQHLRGQHVLVGLAAGKLRHDLFMIYEALPKDVQQSLLATPHRAALLGLIQRPPRQS